MVKDPNCKNKFYRVAELDNIIFDEIRKLELEHDYLHEIKDKHRSADDAHQKVKIISGKLNDIENQISRFLDLYGKGMFTITQLDEKIKPLDEQKKKLNAELDAIIIDEPNMTDADAISIVSSFSDALEKGDFKEIRGIVTSLINRIDIDNDEIKIHWNFV